MKFKAFIFLVALLLNVSSVFAQSNTVRGTVTDQNGDLLIGVSVSIKGTTTGTMTDLDGNYTIQADRSNTLVFTYVGYQTQEVTVTSQIMNVIMVPSENVFDDVIVVAYGTASKAGYTGSASTLKAKDIANSQVSSVSRLLQGAASGIQSSALSGQPGSDADVYIRGLGSINASNKPLFILDGAPYDGSLSSLNPADIASINVLKDAASTALYGSRGGNGLVIITTKQGNKNEKPVVEARFSYGISDRAVKTYKQVTTDQYFKLTWEAMRNQSMYGDGESAEVAAQYASNNIIDRLGINPYGPAYPQPVDLNGNIVAGAKPLWDDNWADIYEQDAHRIETNLSISGGTEKSTYFISLNYLDDQGIAPSSDFKRYNGRVNLKTEVKKWMRVATSINLTHSKQHAPQGSDSSSNNALFQANLMPSFYPVWERNMETGEYILDKNGNKIADFGYYRPSGASAKYNHMGTKDYNFDRVTREVASVRASIELDLYKGLMYKGSINIDYTNRNDHSYRNPVIGPEKDNPISGQVDKYNSRTTGFTGNNLLTYQTTFNEKHNMKAMVGHEFYRYTTSYIEGLRKGIPALGLTEPYAASQLSSFNGYSDEYKLLSYFANAEYNYNHKYYGSASIRRDGSARFSPDTRWGSFWSVGGSWRISEEAFLAGNEIVNNLTLRASYGGQGNDNLPEYYAYQALFSIRNNLGESGFVTSRIETPELKWETNLNFNVGLDFGLLNNRLSGSFEYFNRRSKDLLYELPMAPSTGYTGLPSNIGALKNFGVEFSLTGRVIDTRDLKWSISVNGTHYKNKITEMPTGKPVVASTKLLQEDGSIYDFFVVEWAGIDPEDGLPQWYMTDDDGERVKTKNYNNANTTKSKIIAGSALPDLVGGFGTNFEFKGFELSALFAYSIGGKILNQDKSFLLHNGSNPGRAYSIEILDHWTPENRYTDVPRLQTSNSFAFNSTSTRGLVSASYMRMKNITLAYNLPKTLLQKVQINNCRVFLQAENLFTVFGTEGMDPEQNVNGISYFRYPAMRTGSIGINVSF